MILFAREQFLLLLLLVPLIPVIYGLMECGASGYPLVKDDPKALSRTLREMMAVLGQRLEYDETDL